MAPPVHLAIDIVYRLHTAAVANLYRQRYRMQPMTQKFEVAYSTARKVSSPPRPGAHFQADFIHSGERVQAPSGASVCLTVLNIYI